MTHRAPPDRPAGFSLSAQEISAMTTYTAHYRSATAVAIETIEARTPKQALKLARKQAEENPLMLDWDQFEPSANVEEIEITDKHDSSREFWLSDHLRLSHAAHDLCDALEQAVRALNAAPRFPVPDLLTDSYRIAAICDRAITKAKGGAA
jgi:hypothetical protein